jgi:ADP-heptose:LPS heptosyltransferase
MNWLFSTVLAAPPRRKLLRAEKHMALGQVLVHHLQPGAVSLKGAPDEAAQVEAFVAALPDRNGLVVLHPGVSAFGAFKRWPAGRFGALAARLTKERNVNCVVTSGPSEKELAQAVREASGEMAHLAPELNIGGLIELLGRADCVVACDTGPLHVAAVMDRPLVAVFGPKDPAVYAPYSKRVVIVRKDLDCSPCTRRRCDHVSCIREIEVADVLAAVEERLRAGRDARD